MMGLIDFNGSNMKVRDFLCMILTALFSAISLFANVDMIHQEGQEGSATLIVVPMKEHPKPKLQKTKQKIPPQVFREGGE